MSRYRLTQTAQRDLAEIWAYVAADRPSAARKLVQAIVDRFVLLSQHPLLGEVRDDLAPGVRIFTYRTYVIGYRPMADGIEIVRVVSGHRDLPSLF
jgi:toxin ParE1/3/4